MQQLIGCLLIWQLRANPTNNQKMTDYFHEHNLRGVITPKSLIMLRGNNQQTYVLVISLKNAASGFYNRVSTCDLIMIIKMTSIMYTIIIW